MGFQAYNTHIEDFVKACRKVAEYGLVRCSSGNMSCRIQKDTALLSASGSWLLELTEAQVSVCNIQTGSVLNDVKPTCESALHYGILKTRPDVNVVLHFQSPYATAIACGTPENRNFNMTIEIPAYIGTPAVIPYLAPGSGELAQATVNALGEPQGHIAILKNHGLVSVGKDFNDAIQKACFFEMTCQIILTNPNAAGLEKNAVQDLQRFGQA